MCTNRGKFLYLNAFSDTTALFLETILLVVLILNPFTSRPITKYQDADFIQS